MTKQEVLQGALALNGDDKKYTITVEDDKITIETKYYGTVRREATFRFVARLRDDNTYTETSFDSDGYRVQYGSFTKTKKSVSFTFGGKNENLEVEKDSFDSESCKDVLREYLASCGYEKQGFFKRLFRMKKHLFLITLLLSPLSLTSCKVNWFGSSIDVPWYFVVLPTAALIIAVSVAAYVSIISKTYICPECKNECKPRWNAFSVCLHVNGKRVVQCPKCGRKGFCERKK